MRSLAHVRLSALCLLWNISFVRRRLPGSIVECVDPSIGALRPRWPVPPANVQYINQRYMVSVVWLGNRLRAPLFVTFTQDTWAL